MHRDQDGCHAKSGLRQMTIATSAIEQAIFAGVPVKPHLTLLAAAVCGSDRRPNERARTAGHSVGRIAFHLTLVPRAPIRNRLDLAVGEVAYKAYRDQLDSDRWQRLANLGARAQQLSFASTETKDLSAADTLCADGLAATYTVNTMPRGTLKATVDHGTAADVLPRDGGEGALLLSEFEKARVDVGALAERLQAEGAEALVQPWRELLQAIDANSTTLREHANATAKRKA